MSNEVEMLKVLENAKPILFNGEMVRAILDGRKTQTRRVIKPQPTWSGTTENFRMNWAFPKNRLPIIESSDINKMLAPYAPYQPGQVLWVREPARVSNFFDYSTGIDLNIQYLADDKNKVVRVPQRMEIAWFKKYRRGLPYWVCGLRGIPNGIFREACRLWLRVTNVRTQILPSISTEDAIAEGMSTSMRENEPYRNVKEQFATLWDSCAKPGFKWNDFPWVWAYTFERCDKPEGWE